MDAELIERVKAVLRLLDEELNDAGRCHSIFLKDAFSGQWEPGAGTAVQISSPLRRAAATLLAELEGMTAPNPNRGDER
jgi:hypothetical protein